MTAFSEDQARLLIPGAFERNVPLHRETRTTSPLPAARVQEARPRPETDSTSYVVAAPVQPTTFLGQFAAILGDVVLGTVLVLGVALVPVLAVQAIGAAAAFILQTLGR